MSHMHNMLPSSDLYSYITVYLTTFDLFLSHILIMYFLTCILMANKLPLPLCRHNHAISLSKSLLQVFASVYVWFKIRILILYP